MSFLCSFEGAKHTFNHSGGYSAEATPVPIPNTVVKLSCAENTWLETARKPRSLPDPSSLPSREGLLFLLSSAVEHSAVNRRVAGSNPAGGAKRTTFGFHPFVVFFVPERLI